MTRSLFRYTPIMTFTMTSIIVSSLFIIPDLSAKDPKTQKQPEITAPQKTPSTQPTPQSPAQPWLGVVLEKSTRFSSDGIRIERVMRESPAEKAGIKPGDHIIQLQGKPVQSAGKLQMLVRGHSVGDTLKVSATRDSKPIDFDVTLTPTPTRDQIFDTQLLHQPAPAMSLQMLSPKSYTTSLEKLTGRPTIIEFWATWCQPCKPVAAELAKLKEKHGEKIYIVGVSSEDTDTLTRFIEKNGAPPYLLAKDLNTSGHDAFLVSNYPIVFLLNAEHRIEGIYIGRDNLKDLEIKLNGILPGPAHPDPLPQ